MGLIVLEIEVANPATPEKTEKVEFLIDSGAIYSVVPTPVLERLGIRPFMEQQFRLADGSKIVRKKGGALFQAWGTSGRGGCHLRRRRRQHPSRRFHIGSPRPFAGPTTARVEASADDPR